MIREASGASVGSLYHHFKSKEQIAAALFLEGLKDHHSRLNAALTLDTGGEEGVKLIVRVFVYWVAENPEWARFVFSSRGLVKHTPVSQELDTENKKNFDLWKAWFSKQVASGEIRRLPKEMYYPLIIGPVAEYARAWLAGRSKTDIRDYCKLFELAAWQAVGVNKAGVNKVPG